MCLCVAVWFARFVMHSGLVQVLPLTLMDGRSAEQVLVLTTCATTYLSDARLVIDSHR